MSAISCSVTDADALGVGGWSLSTCSRYALPSAVMAAVPRWPGAVGRHEASVPQSGHGHTPTVVTTLLSWATVLNPSKDLDLGERQRLPLCHTEILHGSSSPPDIHVASTDTDRAVAYLRLVLDQYQAVGDPDEVATASKKDRRRQAEPSEFPMPRDGCIFTSSQKVSLLARS